MVNFFVLDAVLPVYWSVPVVPLLPRTTALALLPNTPLALALLIVAILKLPVSTVSTPLKVLMPLSVNVPLPALVIGAPPLPSLTTPEIVVLPLPSTVRALPLASTPPAPMVRRLPELFLQVWAPPTLTGAVIVKVNAFALSISMPRPAVPLIVLPASVSVTPEMVTFCPTLPVIQRPPAVVVAPRVG